MKRFQFKIWHLLLAITVVAVFSPMLPYPYDEPQRLTDIEILRALAEKNPKLDPAPEQCRKCFGGNHTLL